MDRTTRWETEALRASGKARQSPPRPTKASRRPATNWVTLKEAEAATGVPVNTLRKWVRKSAIPSYLESDGDLALRMVDLDAVERRARELGREPRSSQQKTQRVSAPTEPSARSSPAWEPSPSDPQVRTEPDRPETDVATMMVPVDAWNKMLSQLGNLHEAGQQLAAARERAAKAETEAAFLRQRLTELRTETEPESDMTPAPGDSPVRSHDSDEVTKRPDADWSPPDTEPSDPSPSNPGSDEDGDGAAKPTTTYWRYLTTGWRERRRRGSD